MKLQLEHGTFSVDGNVAYAVIERGHSVQVVPCTIAGIVTADKVVQIEALPRVGQAETESVPHYEVPPDCLYLKLDAAMDRARSRLDDLMLQADIEWLDAS